MVLSLPLLSCESPVSVKENPDRKKKKKSISLANLILGVNDVMVSYLIYCDSLLQNTTDIIIIYGSYFITKCDKLLLQNVTVITKYDDYYKLRQYADIKSYMFSR